MLNRIAYLILLILIPTVGWTQLLDKEYVTLQNKKAAELNRQGNFLQANKSLDQLLVRLEKEQSSESFFARLNCQMAALFFPDASSRQTCAKHVNPS